MSPVGFAAAHPDLAGHPLPLVCAAPTVLDPGRPDVIAPAHHTAGYVWLPAPGHASMLTPHACQPGGGTVVLPCPLGGSGTADPPVPVITAAQAWACATLAKGHVRLEAALTEPRPHIRPRPPIPSSTAVPSPEPATTAPRRGLAPGPFPIL